VQQKQYAEPVTGVDRKAESAIANTLNANDRDGILSEESPPVAGKNDRTWVIDPLDAAILLGIPYAAVSIALCRETDVLIGVVADPFRLFYYTAARKEGATLNGAPLHVSELAHSEAALRIVSYHEKAKTASLATI
jgi:myo-inositol-1(or 4)-monophosphatase